LRCWVWNIDRKNADFFAKELKAGRLRQGWGYEPRLDLRRLKQKVDSAKPLDAEEQRCWKGCSPMILSIEKGDLIVVKNVPDGKSFTIAKVNGRYDFRIDPKIGDFGHLLPVAGGREFHKLSAAVPAQFASAIDRAQSRIIPTDKHADRVIALYGRRQGLSDKKPEELRGRIGSWRTELISHLKKHVREALQHKNAERLIEMMLKQRGISVDFTAGPNERGADMVGTASFASLENLNYRVAIQVKMHDKVENDTTGLDQLERALSEHRVDACLLVSFADRLGNEFDKRLRTLKRKHNFEVLYGDDLYSELLDLIVNHNEIGVDD
jgi:hypothetical protein